MSVKNIIKALSNVCHSNYLMYTMLKKNKFQSIIEVTTPIIEHVALDVIGIKEQLFHSLKKSPSDFSVYYQPIYQINNQINPSAFEALARWSNPYNLGPAQFMQIIESDDDLRRNFARVIANRVVPDAHRLLLYYPTLKYISINVTFADLSEGFFIGIVRNLLSKYPSVKSHLVIEITETQKVQINKIFLKNINELSKLGIHLALDDLGSGFATINSLHLAIWSWVKLDKTLVKGIEQCPNRYRNLKHTIEQCINYQSKIVVEGIENEEQHTLIDQIKRPNLLIQGYYYGKPSPLVNWL